MLSSQNVALNSMSRSLLPLLPWGMRDIVDKIVEYAVAGCREADWRLVAGEEERELMNLLYQILAQSYTMIRKQAKTPGYRIMLILIRAGG